MVDRTHPDLGDHQLVTADGASTAAVADVLTYTPPAGRSARVGTITRFDNTGAPTTQVQLRRGAETIVVRQDAAGFRENLNVMLEPGDTLAIRVTVLAAGGSSDFSASIEELL